MRTLFIPVALVATLWFGHVPLEPWAAFGQEVKGKVEAGGGKEPKVELQVGDVDGDKSETVVKEVKEVTRTESFPTSWLLIGGVGALFILVLVVLAVRGGGGTTIVREKP
jgi:hypothetical protein